MHTPDTSLSRPQEYLSWTYTSGLPLEERIELPRRKLQYHPDEHTGRRFEKDFRIIRQKNRAVLK